MIQKPETTEDIFKREKFEVICPFKSNSDIWNEAKYDVHIQLSDEDGARVVIIRPKKPPKDNL